MTDISLLSDQDIIALIQKHKQNYHATIDLPPFKIVIDIPNLIDKSVDHLGIDLIENSRAVMTDSDSRFWSYPWIDAFHNGYGIMPDDIACQFIRDIARLSNLRVFS